MTWFDERLHVDVTKKGYAQRFEVSRVIVEKKTAFQELVIFETRSFGRVLALDGVIQVTEADEFVYHEMLTHLPMFAHGRVRRVLIIGAGDGGILREVLRHPVDEAVMVEIDGDVIAECRKHMPGVSAGAFDDARARILVDDGIRYVAEAENASFDLIICDSTDPIGPGEVLFTDAFYRDCHRVLTKGGVMVNQNGVPFFQPDEVTITYRRLGPMFRDMGFYAIVVPTYVGGFMTVVWATDDTSLRALSEAEIAARVAPTGMAFRYYSPAVHKAAFVLPPFIAGLMKS